VGTIDKAVLVLDALADGPLALAELVAATGLSRATAHRLATALEAHDLVRRDDEGRFAPGLRLVALGRAAAEAFPLADAALPALAALRDATGESTQLYVREHQQRICVAALESPHGLRTIVPLGAALPLDRGSAGKVLLEADGVAERGWAESVGEREPGVASVSAPVHDRSGRLVAAVSVSGPIERTGRSPGERWGAEVSAAARQIEQTAGR
jgi:DNA-binding IclR family transcriptional regulator